MLLKSITYHNFRPFKGTQKIDLTTKGLNKENVVVLLGDNTFGKSTFVLSFIWCLYGQSKFTKADSILNIKVEDEMPLNSTETASVEIEFEDDNKNYTMVRSQKFYKLGNGNLQTGEATATLSYQTPEGETKRIGPQSAQISLAIKSILPPDLSSFFFFEGEKNNELSRQDLRAAVETLIGLGALQEMREHLFGKNQGRQTPDSVLGEYLEKQKDESGAKAQEEYAKYKECEQKLAEIKQNIEEINENIRVFEEKKEDINKLLLRAAPSEEIRRSLYQNAKNKKECEDAIEETSKDFLAWFSDKSLPIFFYPFLNKITEVLRELDIEDKGIKGLDATAIHTLLKRGICLCGTDLKEGSAPYKNVQKYIEFVPPRSIGVLVKELLDTVAGYSGKAEDCVEQYEKLYNKIVFNKNKLNECESNEKDLTDKLRKIGSIDISEADRLPEYNSHLTYQREKLKEAIADQTMLDSESKNALANYQVLLAKENKSARYKKYYQYALAIYNTVEKELIKKKMDIRNKLESSLQEVFKKIYSGDRNIYIDDKYNIKLTLKNGVAADDSGGLRIIQYFSYVAALVKVACEMMEDRNKDREESIGKFGEQYPLVLDAAFSHADTGHTQSIARELAKTVPQLIFAIMHKDWVLAQEGLVGKIARVYELEKIDETEVRIKQL